ncbi:hypothetical protein [Streptomyces albipurpureus]|uniref:Uncharacterized protein n=1 Tax=Streptomyces albipurpureus TaxID=2897419 RepID=A0ABT0UZS7_9ACTN|nr:hypothetical protein [Streptomyces sp. CWNU-1]MCM2394087.1 hypothetical protein [Streptomyces sp. CWNU-1]
MILPEWLKIVVEREFDEDQCARVAEVITVVNESTFSAEELKCGKEVAEWSARLVGAIVISHREGWDLDMILTTTALDWRDLLMGTGLEHGDWREVLVTKLADPSDRRPLIG